MTCDTPVVAPKPSETPPCWLLDMLPCRLPQEQAKKSTSEAVEIDVLAPCMAACFLTCLERVFHPQTGSCKLYMWMLKTNTAGTGTWAVTNKEAYLITLKADILSADNQKLLLFQFQIQVFKQMGASSNGGTPNSHPKCWSLFSRKTNPWFCWVCTTILVRNPQISSNFHFPRRLAAKLDKDLLWAKPCLRIRVAWWLLPARNSLSVRWFWRKIWTHQNYLKIDGFPLKYVWKKKLMVDSKGWQQG